MPSLVEEVLQPNAAGLEPVLAEVGERLQELKLATQSQLLQHYNQFLPSYTHVLELESRLDGATKEVDDLLCSIQNQFQPQVEKTLEDMKDVEKGLETLRTLGGTIQQLRSIYHHLEEFKKVQCESDFLAAARNIGQVVSLFEHCRNRLDDPGLVKALFSELALKRSYLVMDLNKEWKSFVHVDPETSTLTLPEEGSRHFFTLLQSLHLVKELPQLVREFGSKLDSHFIQRLLKEPKLQLQEMEIENGRVSLTLKTVESNRRDVMVPDIFSNLKVLLLALHRHLDNSGEPLAEEPPAPPRLVTLLGAQLGPALSKAIVSECLEPALRTKCKDTYSSILSAGSQFQDLLLEIGFLTADQLDSIDSIQNMDVFFAKWMCEDILAQARKIIQKNLYETFVYEDSDLFKIPQVDGSGEPATPSPNILTLQNIHHFPTCEVSTSMKELLGLIEQILEEAFKDSTKMGIKLIYTARYICELFCAVAPVSHRTAIETLPQQTALFHNNCMFLAHNLLLLGRKFQDRLPSSEVTFTFADLVPKIRQLGTEAFLKQMRQHRDILQEFVAGDEVMEQLADGPVPEVERAIHQMVSQLRLLRGVWHSVLPRRVFLKAMGTLVNSSLEQLISRVVKLEDIHSDGATLLVTVFQDLMDRLPALFQEEETAAKEESLALAMQHVKLWSKFSELVRLLGASMKDIVDRWADGRGALAAAFTEVEVCHLIRALFQNTERRATALAQIRHRAFV